MYQLVLGGYYTDDLPHNFPPSTLMYISIAVTYCNVSLFKNFEGALEIMHDFCRVSKSHGHRSFSSII